MMNFFRWFSPFPKKKKDEKEKSAMEEAARAWDKPISNQEINSADNERQNTAPMNFFSQLSPKEEKDEHEMSPLEEAARAGDQAISNQDIERQMAEPIYIASFTVQELSAATGNFHNGNLLGHGRFSTVYKGTIDGQIMAMKQLYCKESEDDMQKFQWEVSFLSGIRHPNLVKLLGFCRDGFLLVYEFMSKGSLDRHLFNIDLEHEPLSWYQRMKIALDVARGLEYLHRHEMAGLTIYRELKCSNILLDEEYDAKLSNFGYNFGIPADLAPKLTTASDIYSLGVLMLELITGREAVDDTNSPNNLVMQAQLMSGDEKRYKDLPDSVLEGRYPEKGLKEAVKVAIMSVQEDPESRPTIRDVIQALSNLAEEPKYPTIPDRSELKGPMHGDQASNLSKRLDKQLTEDIRLADRACARDQASSSSKSPTAKDERCTS